MIKLRWIFRKWDVVVWTGLSWLRIGKGGGLRTALFWVIAQRVVVVSYILGQPIGPILRVQESKGEHYREECGW
jgi:hypothetical protein